MKVNNPRLVEVGTLEKGDEFIWNETRYRMDYPPTRNNPMVLAENLESDLFNDTLDLFNDTFYKSRSTLVKRIK